MKTLPRIYHSSSPFHPLTSSKRAFANAINNLPYSSAQMNPFVYPIVPIVWLSVDFLLFFLIARTHTHILAFGFDLIGSVITFNEGNLQLQKRAKRA